MSALDEAFRQVGESLIGALGASATLTLDENDWDPASGVETSPEETPIPITISPPAAYTAQEIDGTVVQVDDMKASAAAKKLEELGVNGVDLNKYRLTAGGSTFRIVRAFPVYSGDQVALWMMQLRK